MIEAKNLTPPYGVIKLAGALSLFSICFEQSWKILKEVLSDHGFVEAQTSSPKQILKPAYKIGLINQEEKWMAMLASGNEASHSFNEEVALNLIVQIQKNCIGLFVELKKDLEEKWLDDCNSKGTM